MGTWPYTCEPFTTASASAMPMRVEASGSKAALVERWTSYRRTSDSQLVRNSRFTKFCGLMGLTRIARNPSTRSGVMFFWLDLGLVAADGPERRALVFPPVHGCDAVVVSHCGLQAI